MLLNPGKLKYVVPEVQAGVLGDCLKMLLRVG